MTADQPQPEAPARRRRWARVRPRRVAIGVAACLVPILMVLAYPLDSAHYLSGKASGEVHDRKGELLAATLNPDEQWCFERRLGELSPTVVQATLAAEDGRFFEHGGVDFLAMGRAAWQLARNRRIVSGASTITMQLVKMRDRTPRSFPGKLGQVVQALRLELCVSKPQIMAAYLNSAPYGSNLVGIEAASRRYFGKPARQLSPAEAALLAGMPKAPSLLDPLRHPERARTRRDWVLARMHLCGFLTDADYETAVTSPLGASWNGFPSEAPALLERYRTRLAAGETVATTLDRGLQVNVQNLVRAHIRATGSEVENAAVVVIDVESATTLVRISSADFFGSPGGQIDACTASRSPGSALKPFAYALALERNLVYPNEVVGDAPMDFGVYMPQNFDRRFRGSVSIADSLRQSLNIPAAKVLMRLGPEEFLSFLRSCSISTLDREADHYGLALALGGCEVRLDELAAAYTAIANLGVARPVRLLATDPVPEGTRLLREDTCRTMFRILQQPLPGECPPAVFGLPNGSVPVCWKTGTSNGYHDAWAFVFDRRYVVGVWMGNADGRASEKLVGARIALPLAAQVYRAISSGTDSPYRAVHQPAAQVAVCCASGLPATRHCPTTRLEALAGTPAGQRLCGLHAPPALAATGRLRIVQPAPASRFALTGSVRANNLPLRAEGAAEGEIHWYIDGQHLGASTPERALLLTLAPGAHTVAALDTAGNTATSEFAVE